MGFVSFARDGLIWIRWRPLRRILANEMAQIVPHPPAESDIIPEPVKIYHDSWRINFFFPAGADIKGHNFGFFSPCGAKGGVFRPIGQKYPNFPLRGKVRHF